MLMSLHHYVKKLILHARNRHFLQIFVGWSLIIFGNFTCNISYTGRGQQRGNEFLISRLRLMNEFGEEIDHFPTIKLIHSKERAYFQFLILLGRL